MASWNSRLQVQVNGQLLTPITSFTTVFTTSTTAIHSIEADNVGVIQKPRTMTFTMTVPAVLNDPSTPGGPFSTAAILYKLAVDGTAFNVALTVQSGTDWVFKQLLFRNCFITSANPSNVTVSTTSGQLDTTPVSVFSGIVTDFGDADITTA
jgi:hypothetical protein